jgi:hypothetical protein
LKTVRVKWVEKMKTWMLMWDNYFVLKNKLLKILNLIIYNKIFIFI